MIPWVQLGAATVPEDGGELRLMQRGTEFSIMAGSTELMNSRLSGSEEALATLTCSPLATRAGARILIGGLGMGFTLRTALSVLGPHAAVTVAELVPAVVAWARGPLAALHDESLHDPRVTIFEGDVGVPIRQAASIPTSPYDAILLDVDNGPAGLTRAANDGLYGSRGLEAAMRALRPGGALAVWSATPDAGFTRRLKVAGFAVEEVPVRARGKRGARHLIWLAKKP